MDKRCSDKYKTVGAAKDKIQDCLDSNGQEMKWQKQDY